MRLNLSHNSLPSPWEVNEESGRSQREQQQLQRSGTSFTMLDLGHNRFTGSIPTDLCDCLMITVLKLDHNSLNGTIPDERFNATLLEHLSFRNAGLRGTLDAAYAAKLSGLITLDLGENQFTSKIPDSIGHLKRFGELTKVNFSTLENLERLDLASNKFSGMVPESIYFCTNLTALRLADNKFYGELSPKIGNLKSLTSLSLYKNTLTNITNSLQILKSSKNLRALLLGKNFMHEGMPQDKTIDGFDNLQVLGMQRLTGDIPTTLAAMKKPNSIKTAAQFDRSFFALPIYLTVSHQYRLTLAFPNGLDLSNNDFTGVISEDISQLKALNSLNLSYNRFYGKIPQALSGLTDLQVLDLSSNLLNGTIPVTLNTLQFLNVSNNDLEGPVPTEGQLSTFPGSSFDGNPKLCGSILVHHYNPVEATPDSFFTSKDRSEKQAGFMMIDLLA
ncbi:hypothetical protein EJB05_25206, partial [Eragrostis curvula]